MALNESENESENETDNTKARIARDIMLVLVSVTLV